jgi:hypothetical protein
MAVVKMIHVRKAGQCSAGARAFFYRHNLNWPEFLKSGIDSEILLKTNDALARKVVEVAERENYGR